MSDDFASSGRTTMGATHPKPNADWERRNAARTVADHSHTVDECIEFLDMLGLTAADGKTPPVSKAAAFNPYGGARREQT